jgi:hypothetical protein
MFQQMFLIHVLFRKLRIFNIQESHLWILLTEIAEMKRFQAGGLLHMSPRLPHLPHVFTQSFRTEYEYPQGKFSLDGSHVRQEEYILRM